MNPYADVRTVNPQYSSRHLMISVPELFGATGLLSPNV